tara:strand:+ start:370 stop:1356 length:987 start_codon:yes stop_codon:yes gene_type:complete
MENEITILLYHGVTEHENIGITNHANKHLNVNDFSEQMKWLNSNANLLSMDEVAEMFQKNLPFPERSVAVTFDDGYKNNYSTAMPVLDKYKIPTTFYIAAGMIGEDDLFWVDKIESCIEKTKEKKIEISLGGNIVKYNLDNDDSKLHALYSIKKYCKLSSQQHVDLIVEELIEKTKVNPSIGDNPNYSTMNWNEVRELHKNKNFIIGGHSLKHEIFSNLDTEFMKNTVKKSLEIINKELDSTIEHYSYPEGIGKQFSYEVVTSLKKNKIKCCPTARYGKNTPSINLFNLYRVMVGLGGTPFPYNAISNGDDLELLDPSNITNLANSDN